MILRVSLVLAFLYSSLSAWCGFILPEYYEFNFLNKRDFSFSNIDKNLNYTSTYNNILRDRNKKIKEKNLDEWKKEFGDAYTKEQIKTYLYKKKNLEEIKNQDIKEYIKLVIEQEPYVSNDRKYYLKYGYRGKKLNKLRVDTMISDALTKIATIKSNYLKTRYFFLALRLAHYYNKANALKIYEDNKNLLKNSKSIVKDWIQGLYAGILLKKGKKAESVYEFTKLFEEGKLNWYLAFYNFNINTDKEWKKLISLAKNKEEKIKFFTIRALDANANILEELKNIASIDKNSRYFDLILFRKLLKSQNFFANYPEDSRFEKKYEDFTPYIEYLKSVSKDDMYTVNLALAYFSFYQDDIKSSKEYLQKAYKIVKGDDIDELNALDYIIYLNGIKTIDKKVENVIGKKLEKLSLQKCNGKAIYRYTFNTIKDIYKENGDEFKYFISASYEHLSTDDINLDKYNKIQALRNKKDKTELEKYMLKNIILKDAYFEKSLQRAYFEILMNSLEFEKALKEVPSDDYKLRLNIFNNLIKGNNRRFVKNKMTIKQTLQKIIQIKENLKKNPNLPMDNYLYGTALYNLSYWGNLNDLTTVYYWTSTSFKEKDLELRKLNLSTKHFKIALKNTKDKEFKAKITYMLAKNELALYDIKYAKIVNYYGKYKYRFKRLNYGSYTYSFSEIKDYMIFGYGKYFDKLKKDYSNTNYYKELINECANLRNYQYTLKEVNGPKIEPTWSSQKLLENLEADFKYKGLEKRYDKIFFWKLLRQVPITKKTVTRYNNIAYYLQKMSSYKSDDYAKIILEKVIEKFPNRIVAYYNLGDIYWIDYNRVKAKELYKKYIELMKKAGKEKKIPQKVKDRVR